MTYTTKKTAKEILKEYNIENDTLAKKCDTYAQLRALEAILKHGYNPEDALKFKSFLKDDNALSLLELGYKADDALKIYTSFHGYDAARLLAHDKSLNLTTEEKANFASKFTNHNQVKSLEILLQNGQDLVGALKFGYKVDLYSFEALKLGLDADNALRIDSALKLEALQALGKDRVDEVSKFSITFQIQAFKEGLEINEALQFKAFYNVKCYKAYHNIEEALQCNNHFNAQAYTIAKEYSLENFDAAFQVNSQSSLESFINSLEHNQVTNDII